jgi:hypothetical protein
VKDKLASEYHRRLQLQPALPFVDQIVIRKREKMKPVLFIPNGDHLGIIVTVAPERMRVQVSFPPEGLGRRVLRAGGTNQRQKAENGRTCGSAEAGDFREEKWKVRPAMRIA